MILLPTDFWEIRTTDKKGQGIFAKQDIQPGTIIGDYIGRVIRTAQEDTYEKDDGLYLMYYHDYATIYPVDVHTPGIHLINHSCTPNCYMYTYKGHTLFFSLRRILKNEELTVSYLISPDESCTPCTHICRCEEKNCSHSMHMSQDAYDKWNEFNLKESEKTKKKRVTYGKVLPKLDSYPAHIKDNPIYPIYGSNSSTETLDDQILPKARELRKIIKKTGKRLVFPNVGVKIIGVEEEKIISEKL